MNKAFSSLFQVSFFTCCSLIANNPVTAQSIGSDGTLPTPTEVTPTATGVEINGGTTRGGNLFHSFKDFSIPTGSEAFFNNAPDVVNILNRVTGGNISSIDGLLRANGSANLFLINPAGIVFGKGASLKIGGSFYGSTADSILFPDGVEFSATNTQAEPILTINAPIGLNFRDNPGDIVNRSNANGFGLSVPEGESISLIGGNVKRELHLTLIFLLLLSIHRAMLAI
jgi:filamentous hemagglutinin family protein